MGAGLALLSTTIAPGGGDVRGHGVLVALVLEDVDEEADDEAELVISVVDVEDAVLSVVLEVVVIVEVVVLNTSKLVEVAVFMQEHPLDILDGKSKHSVAHAGSVAEAVAVA